MLKGRERDAAILRRLDDWSRTPPEWPHGIDTGLRLLRLGIESHQRIDMPRPRLSRDAVSALLLKGQSLLSFEEMDLDWQLLKNVFGEAARVLAGGTATGREDIGRLDRLADNPALLRQVASCYYQDTSLSAIASEHCLDPGLLTDCTRAAMAPFLQAQSEALAEIVGQELWRRSHCPVCQGLADFAYINQDSEARWLICCRCSMEWLFQRIQCPYCDTQKHESLSYRTNSQGLYQLYTCDECHTYIKGIDLRKAGSQVLLPLERVLTAGLDRQAREAHYLPGYPPPLWSQFPG